jgi:hypothetical protein
MKERKGLDLKSISVPEKFTLLKKYIKFENVNFQS